MAQLTRLYHLMRADFFERSRRYSFVITLGLVVVLAYFYLPPAGVPSIGLWLGNHRGVYNSAWVGGSVAVLCSMLLSLPAFYLVKNAIERDERTRVGQILATTPMSKPLYTLGKAFSNFIFLAVMVGVIIAAGAAMQLLRGEEHHLDLWALLSPILFCALPAMAVIAALAILFESIGWLRGTLGNALYFVLWLGILIVSAPGAVQSAVAPDPWGIGVLASAMKRDAAAAFPDYTGSFGLGGGLATGPVQTFVWEGMHWTAGILLGRMLWLGAAIGLGLLAALFFRRFDPAATKIRRTRATVEARPAEPGEAVGEQPALPAGAASLSPMTAGFRPRRGALLLAELRILLKETPWWWTLVALGLVLAAVAVPADAVRWMLVAVWLWPLALWSSLGCREARHHTHQLLFSTPHLLGRQLPALWLAGVVVALVTGSGVAVRLALAEDWAHLAAWGTAALFIPSLALALGTWSSGNKLFEVVYMVWWYVGPVNRTPTLDFTGLSGPVSTGALAIYGVGAIVLLTLAALGRRRQARG